MVRNPRTAKQMEHRALFRQEVQLAAQLRRPVLTGLTVAGRETGMTSYNLFVHLNQRAFGSDNGQLTVDWGALQFSAGPVAPVALGTPIVDDRNILSVSFEKNPLHLRADALDEVYLYVHCPALDCGCMAAPVCRIDKKIRLLLPDDFAGQELYLYAFAQDSHGRTSSTAVGCTIEAAETPEAPAETAPADDATVAVTDTSDDSTQKTAAKAAPPDPAQLSLW